MTQQILEVLTAQVEPIRLAAKIERKENAMHQIETGLPSVTSTRPSIPLLPRHPASAVEFVARQTQDSIPACITCGTTDIAEVGYNDGAPAWSCANGHVAEEIDEQAIMPEYALLALAADFGPYDWPGDTARDEGRAA